MLHHILLVRLKPTLPPDEVENLMVESRIRLLKIPEVMNLRCGKRIDLQNNPYDFFIAVDVENSSKMRVVEESAVYLQFRHRILNPAAAETLRLDYEMEPGKDVAFS